MTDRINAIVVTLEADFREDDVRPLMAAIMNMRGVAAVDMNVSDIESHIATTRAKAAFVERVADFLRD